MAGKHREARSFPNRRVFIMGYKNKFTKERVAVAIVLFLIAKYYLGLTAQFVMVDGDWGIRAVVNSEDKNLWIIQNIVVVNPPPEILSPEK